MITYMSRFSHGDIVERTTNVTIACIKRISQAITKEKDYTWDYIYKQLGKSIGSLGANVTEADVAISNKECKRILAIALREGNESLYWINVFDRGLNKKIFNEFVGEIKEVCKIINTIMQKIQ